MFKKQLKTLKQDKSVTVKDNSYKIGISRKQS